MKLAFYIVLPILWVWFTYLLFMNIREINVYAALFTTSIMSLAMAILFGAIILAVKDMPKKEGP